VLANLGVELAKLRSAVEFVIGRGDRAVLGEIGLTPRAKKVMELAVDEARWLSHHYIGTEHLLIGLVREGEGIAAGVLESLGVNLQRVRRETERLLSTNLPQGTSGTAGPALRRSEGRAGGELARLLAELERVRREKDTAISRQEYETATRLRDHEVELEGRIERLERIAEATRRASEARTRPEAGSGGGEPWSLQQHAAFREGFALGLAFTGEARKVLESALAEATRLGAASIRTEHLILALLLPEGPLVRELKKHGVDIERVRAAMREPGGEHRPPEDQESG